MAIKTKISRRDILKGLATLPVLGYFGFSFFRKRNAEARKTNERRKLLSELGLDFQADFTLKDITVPQGKGDLIRIGIVGVGNRGSYLLRSLGYADKNWISEHKDNSGNPDDTLKAFHDKAELNIEITAICDVFDLHLQRGIEISTYNRRDQLHTGKPAKGYKDYRKMLEDKNVDAIIIATPDFWHGSISTGAIRTGKHVYCEKCMTNNEEEAIELYDVVKSHQQVFQVGHQYLQNDAFQRARQLIQRNKTGKVTLIETVSNRNSEDSAWIRHLDENGRLKPGNNLKLTIDRDSLQYAKYIKSKMIAPGQVFYEYRQDIDEIDAITSPTEQYYASKGLTYTVKNGKKTDVSYLHLKEWLDCIRFVGTPGCGIEKGFETTIALPVIWLPGLTLKKEGLHGILSGEGLYRLFSMIMQIDIFWNFFLYCFICRQNSLLHFK